MQALPGDDEKGETTDYTDYTDFFYNLCQSVPLPKFIYQHILHNFSLLPPKAVRFSSAVSKNACALTKNCLL